MINPNVPPFPNNSLPREQLKVLVFEEITGFRRRQQIQEQINANAPDDAQPQPVLWMFLIFSASLVSIIRIPHLNSLLFWRSLPFSLCLKTFLPTVPVRISSLLHRNCLLSLSLFLCVSPSPFIDCFPCRERLSFVWLFSLAAHIPLFSYDCTTNKHVHPLTLLCVLLYFLYLLSNSLNASGCCCCQLTPKDCHIYFHFFSPTSLFPVFQLSGTCLVNCYCIVTRASMCRSTILCLNFLWFHVLYISWVILKRYYYSVYFQMKELLPKRHK